MLEIIAISTFIVLIVTVPIWNKSYEMKQLEKKYPYGLDKATGKPLDENGRIIE